MLLNAMAMSTCCTGAATGEIAAAMIEKIVSEDDYLDRGMLLQPTMCHATELQQFPTWLSLIVPRSSAHLGAKGDQQELSTTSC